MPGAPGRGSSARTASIGCVLEAATRRAMPIAVRGEVARELVERREVASRHLSAGLDVVTKAVDVPGAEGEVDERKLLEQLVLHRLGPAAADDDLLADAERLQVDRHAAVTLVFAAGLQRDRPEQALRVGIDPRVEVMNLGGEVREVELTSVQVKSNEPERRLVNFAVQADVGTLHEPHVGVEQQRLDAAVGAEQHVAVARQGTHAAVGMDDALLVVERSSACERRLHHGLLRGARVHDGRRALRPGTQR